MNKRYTDVDALISDIEAGIETYWNEGSGGYYLAEDVLNYSVKTAPIADVVEVVRCKDCRYSSQWFADRRLCSFWRETGFSVYDDDFCSRGQRSENNAET